VGVGVGGWEFLAHFPQIPPNISRKSDNSPKENRTVILNYMFLMKNTAMTSGMSLPQPRS